MKINEMELQQIMPAVKHPASWVKPLNAAMEKFEIADNVQRVAAFLGQVAHESGSLNRVEENLNYSRRRMRAVWPSRFPDEESTARYGRNPERLANKVYADRMGNGSQSTGDGFRYRGRGLLQITGRENYAVMGRLMDMPGLIESPDILIEPRYAALSAAAYWSSRDLNDAADKLGENKPKSVVRAITKKINGGTHGLDERLEFTERAIEILDTDFSV